MDIIESIIRTILFIFLFPVMVANMMGLNQTAMFVAYFINIIWLGFLYLFFKKE